MPVECIGWFGRTFGHKFDAVTTSVTGPDAADIKELIAPLVAEWFANDVIDMVKTLESKTFAVRCRRCGIEAS